MLPRFLLAAVLATLGCADRPAPARPAVAAASPDTSPLRPLTSRDDPPAAPAARTARPADAGGTIEGEIRIDARVRDQARPGDVLYVIARSAATRQVVAVRRQENVSFPFSFRLSAGDAMMPDIPFEGPFDLTARLSRSGDATPHSGDLEGAAKNVSVGSRAVTVVVDSVRP
jgi:cytochrome c-type biogenesis protein CcmH